MLGQPIYMLMPQVVGFKLTGQLPAGARDDLVLRVVEMLRKKGVVEKFVEFYGPGLGNLKLADRATIANMGPEYGATMGRSQDDEALNAASDWFSNVQRWSLLQAQGLFRTNSTPDPLFSDTLELDLSTVEPALAGPKRPQDRVNLSTMQSTWQETLRKPIKQGGFELGETALSKQSAIQGLDGQTLTHGDVAIAAITSCTNTSNPSVMIAAGLLAKKANALGLKSKPWVKTSLGPGSRVVTAYLEKADLQQHLDALGFNTVGYGCTTCIGNSGPLPDNIIKAINDGDLVVTSVLSGNRNFEGRISPNVKANYLASPPLVVAYALAGTVNIDLQNDSLGKDKDGNDVFLKDIWPSNEEVAAMENTISSDMYSNEYGKMDTVTPMWNEIQAKTGQVYAWSERQPTFKITLLPRDGNWRQPDQ